MSQEAWQSTAVAATALGVTRPTVISWLNAGHLTGKQIPYGNRHRWRVDPQSVTAILESRGGPGAARGRPSGSVTRLHADFARLKERVDQLGGSAASGVPTELLAEVIQQHRRLDEVLANAEAVRARLVEAVVEALREDGAEQARRRGAMADLETSIVAFVAAAGSLSHGG